MPTIFISYRRSDSQDVTGRIYDRLLVKYPREQLFKDVDSNPIGVAFPWHIKQMVSRAGMVLVVIGPNWLYAKNEHGSRRLDDPADFVRLEVEIALRQGMPVVPVLVSNARMPLQSELPQSMRPLVFRHGIAVRPDPDFNHDVGRLLSELDRLETLRGSQRAKRGQVECSDTRPRPVPQTAAGVAPTAGTKRSRKWLLLPLVGLLLAGVWAGGVLPLKTMDETREPERDRLLSPDPPDLIDQRPRIAIHFTDEKRRFGISMVDERDPVNPAKMKRLTYQENGMNNNTCIMIDNYEYLFGNNYHNNKWVLDPELKRPQDLVVLQKGRRWKSVMEWPEGIRVTQLVQIIAGDQTKLLDTCLILYHVENFSQSNRHVGVRCLVNTFIGFSAATRFLVPGQPLIDTKIDVPEKDIPDFIQALETGDISYPGVIVQVGLNLDGLELVNMVRLCRWPDEIGSEVRWDWSKRFSRDDKGIRAINDPPDAPKDSCVVIYWSPKTMAPGERRTMGFTYGLGRVSAPADTGGVVKMALTSGGNFHKGGQFTLTAYVNNPKAGQTVTARLPAGLTLVADKDNAPEKPIAPEPGKSYTAVSWKIRANEAGTHKIEADLKAKGNTLATARDDVLIRTANIFSPGTR